jgi:hypothetical protein
MVPKLFGPIRERYLERPGGYTRVLRIEPLKEDQAASAILELVDGPKDMRFAMTARTLANVRRNKQTVNDITQTNISKVTRYRLNGGEELEELTEKMGELLSREEKQGPPKVVKRKVYPKEEVRTHAGFL